MKIDEILAEMPNLSPKELDAIRAKAHELDVKARKLRLQQGESKPWPPQNDAEWDEFIEWIERIEWIESRARQLSAGLHP